MTRSQPTRFSQFRIRLVTTGRGCGGSCSGSTAGRPPRGTPRIAKENREAVGCHSAVSFWMEFLGVFWHLGWLRFSHDFPFGFCPQKELLVDVGWNFPFLNDFECCFELFTTCSRWVLGFVLGISWIMETANHWYHLATKDAEWYHPLRPNKEQRPDSPKVACQEPELNSIPKLSISWSAFLLTS